jgi:nucleoside-diphosphate-sugar epimerase
LYFKQVSTLSYKYQPLCLFEPIQYIMKVFITGASGYIGSALAKELLSKSHEVTGLARSDSAAEKLKALGVKVVRGTLEHLDVLKEAASQADAVAHLGFVHNFEDFQGSCAIDRAAIGAIGSALAAAGGDRTLIFASGTMLLKKRHVATEDQTYDKNDPFGATRGASDDVANAFTEKGVRVGTIRFPPVVHGDGGMGLVSVILAGIDKTGTVMYADNGDHRWSAVHYLDAARALRLALENAKPGGSVYHLVAEEGVRIKDIAERIGKKLNLPTAGKSAEELQVLVGFMGQSIATDNPSSSAKTKAELGWTPTEKGLLEDLEPGDNVTEFMKKYKP